MTGIWVSDYCPYLGQEAEQAIQCLNGKLALSKKLVVRWAHAQVKVSLRETDSILPRPKSIKNSSRLSIRIQKLHLEQPCFAHLLWCLVQFSLEKLLRKGTDSFVVCLHMATDPDFWLIFACGWYVHSDLYFFNGDCSMDRKKIIYFLN